MSRGLPDRARVDVWCIDLARAARGHDRLIDTLDEHEQACASRFVRASDARRYRVAHGALRTILSRYTAVAPRRIRFARTEHGKPVLRDGGPHFNLSHSGELAMVAVSAACDVGADLERVRPVPDAAALAQCFFAPELAAWIQEQPGARRDRCFMQGWTAMEAILKAQGVGLRGAPDAGAWSLRRLSPAPDYVGAVAAGTSDYMMCVREFT
jgi:4'-phosphopantetheinyl transferase